ncbi:MAG: hypothetical protein HYV60_10330 [Planctomycetia bacterium]|nr:hypothetical protein [Planctomycetia bacterium]
MWQLDGTNVRLETSRLTGQLNLASPVHGLTELAGTLDPMRAFRADGAAIMQLTLPVNATLLTDAYVRGNDLVATYDESADRPCRTQVYWRMLDAAPSLTVASQIAGSVRLVEEGVALMPLLDSNVSYVEVTDGSNVESTIVHNNSQLTNKLFSGSLEKGVIRRARILGCFLPASSAEQTARSLHDRFVRSGPPLTT